MIKRTPQVTDRVIIAHKWINKGYKENVVLDFVGLAASTYYDNMKHDRNKDNSSNNPKGRPIPGYSYHLEGHKVSDEEIKEYLMELVVVDGFPYGYHKLAKCLKEDYLLKINGKKVYRLCKELGIF